MTNEKYRNGKFSGNDETTGTRAGMAAGTESYAWTTWTGAATDGERNDDAGCVTGRSERNNHFVL